MSAAGLVPVTRADISFLRLAVSRIELPEYVDERVRKILAVNEAAVTPMFYRNPGVAKFYVGGWVDSRNVCTVETSSVGPSPVYIPSIFREFKNLIMAVIPVHKFKVEIATPPGCPAGALEKVLKRHMGFSREGCLKGEGFDPNTRTLTNAVVLAHFPGSRKNGR